MFLTIIGFFVSGCVQSKLTQETKWYVQLRNAQTSEIVQWGFPNEQVCNDLLSQLSKKTGWSPLYDTVICSQASISACLPYRTKVKDKATATVIDVATSSSDFCRKFSIDHRGLETLLACHYAMKDQEPGARSGKYLQLRHPTSAQVLLQKDYPDDFLCSEDLSTINRRLQGGGSDISGYLSCNNVSFSQCLPYTAVYKNRITNVIMNTHYTSIEFCNGIAQSSKNNPAVETMSPCRVKKP
ncbi:MAG TPA: hypothetical protein VHO84_02700 [Syntrophorhabdaceae bacterium]|nr:hypothetical protein [Syntrophorhabdaceae bacterium]